MLEFLKNALEFSSGKLGVNYNKLNEYVKVYSNDRRYKISSCASNCTWNYNQSGIILYRGIKYYYEQLGENNIRVELFR